MRRFQLTVGVAAKQVADLFPFVFLASQCGQLMLAMHTGFHMRGHLSEIAMRFIAIQ